MKKHFRDINRLILATFHNNYEETMMTINSHPNSEFIIFGLSELIKRGFVIEVSEVKQESNISYVYTVSYKNSPFVTGFGPNVIAAYYFAIDQTIRKAKEQKII